jgi:hypothetical protein
MEKTILVTADLGHLKAYYLLFDEISSGPRVRLARLESTDITRHLSEVVSDQAGQFRKRRPSATGPNDQSDGEPHNLGLERRRRALKALAKDISALVAREKVDAWHLAAAPEINRGLVDCLDSRTRAKLQENVPANLTRLKSQDLLSHFNFSAKNGNGLGRGSGRNPAQIRRKPAARRTSPLKKTMRRQKLSPEVASTMRGLKAKGDRRRTVAQRIVQNDVHSKLRTRGAE